MSMDPVMLEILARECKEELQMFERVKVIHSKPQGRDCYLCIGKRNLFFVAREMDRLIEGEKLSYLSIEKAVTDETTRRFFALRLTPDADPSWSASGLILIESHHRAAVLERIGLCWQAEYMFKKFEVMKFPQAKKELGKEIPELGADSKHNIDNIQVKPFKSYDDLDTKRDGTYPGKDFKHRGYSFFLRSGFRSASGLKQGTFVHDTGWTERYNKQDVVVPPGIQITVHVHDPIPSMELEKSIDGSDDIRTVATKYKKALTETLGQFYVLANCAYQKRMNRNNDMASWDGWEFFVRSVSHVFICIIFRREYIPPICDVAQDIAVLMRCPAEGLRRMDGNEVLLDECRFVADSLASLAECGRDSSCYREVIQARLDTLQFNEEGYRWLEGNLKLTPAHKKPAAIKFVKSIVQILTDDGHLPLDMDLIQDDVFRDISVLHNPLLVPQEMLSDAEGLIGKEKDMEERRNAWYCRISRYLAYCVDGGIIGDRFTLSVLVSATSKSSEGDQQKLLKQVVEFLLHVRPQNDWKKSFSGSRTTLSQLLQDPQAFSAYAFNERVMRVLLTYGYIQAEWSRKNKASGTGSSYSKLLATMLVSDRVGIGLRTLICRQILDTTNTSNKEEKSDQVEKAQVLVPALIHVMQMQNLSLTSCATAALVNLTAFCEKTKILAVKKETLTYCVEQLKLKDDDLTTYTLYLLVNLTKTPHHRALLCREGGVPVLVDILTSSYQNLRNKSKILTEVASVIGQLCNDRDTRSLISEEFPVVVCFLWIFDAAPVNSKLKSKLLFALRQLCVLSQNKIKVGQHVITTVIDELGQCLPKIEDETMIATNAILLLTMLANIHSNAKMMDDMDRLDDALVQMGMLKEIRTLEQNPKTKFRNELWQKVLRLKERIKESVIAAGGS